MNAFILFSNEKRSELADMNPHLSNAAVSVLLGQRWREMLPNEKSAFVAAAKRIKEEFHAQNPDAKTRCVKRAGGKRAKLDGAGRFAVPRPNNSSPPSLQALALVGSRLNQSAYGEGGARCDSASTYTQGAPSFDAPSRRSYDEEEEDDYDDDDDDEPELRWESSTAPAPASEAPPAIQIGGPSLLEQLCTVAETEHTAAAQMLSAFGAAH